MVRRFLAGLVCWLAVPMAGAVASSDEATLEKRISTLTKKHPNRVTPSRIGVSRDGRPIHLLRLAAGEGDPDLRPALLIVAGIHGQHLVGTDVALGIAETLASKGEDVLGEHTVYLVPRLNPDAAAPHVSGEPPVREFSLTSRPDDTDHDGRVDEDGPTDVDGDGIVTQMRVADPPAGVARTHLPDPDEPRLMKKADPAGGDRATHALFVEGVDADADGSIGEDEPGGVDLDRNFPHQWPEFKNGAGPFPVSEPESLALVEWMLDRPNIAAVLVFGPHDTLVQVPEAGKFDATKRAPTGLEKGDRPYHEAISEIFRDITGITAAPKVDSAGSFHAWAYAQFGVPSFSTPVWVRPDLVKRKESESDDADGGGEPAKGGGAPKKRAGKKSDANDDGAWLRYSDDERRGDGFVDWKPFDHPQLGPVEIGGFVPGFRRNPPPDEIPRLVSEQADFVRRLVEKFPRLSVDEPDVERLGNGVWRVRVQVRNDGYFPTTSAIGVKVRRMTPLILALDHPREAVIAGEPMSRHWSLEGSGGVGAGDWIVAADDGSTLVVEIRSTLLGDRRIEIRLVEKEVAR